MWNSKLGKFCMIVICVAVISWFLHGNFINVIKLNTFVLNTRTDFGFNFLSSMFNTVQ